VRAGELHQFGGIRRVTGFDFPGFGKRQLFEKNSLELRVRVYIEFLSRVLLHFALQSRHFLPELEV
jgi:hypothetical protein